MKLILEGKSYTVKLNENKTVRDILDMLPLSLNLQRRGGHEYFNALPEKPELTGAPMTSNVHAKGIYYYDGWTAFTVLFRGSDISPFRVVHIGDVVEDEVIEHLERSGETILAEVEKQES
ncbi:cyclophilin-like fold protein [Eisenbergiella sp.]